MFENLKKFEILKQKQITILGGTGDGDGSSGDGESPPYIPCVWWDVFCPFN